MQNWFANIEAAFPLLFGGAIGWIVLWVFASILYRNAKGKPLFPRKPDDTVYYESSGSGHSNKNLLTKLGGARNCLLVAVTKDALIVQPKFPFNLMFLPEVYGLEYHVPRKCIRSAIEKNGLLRKSVTVEFSTSGGSRQSIELRLKRIDEFLVALGTK